MQYYEELIALTASLEIVTAQSPSYGYGGCMGCPDCLGMDVDYYDEEDGEGEEEDEENYAAFVEEFY